MTTSQDMRLISNENSQENSDNFDQKSVNKFHYVSARNKNYPEEQALHAPTLKSHIPFYHIGSYVAFDSGKELGFGGYGTVRLYHTLQGVETVIKIINNVNDDDVEDLKREAEFNRICHGIGDIDIDYQNNIGYLRMKKLPPSINTTIFNYHPTIKFKDMNAFKKFFNDILKATRALHDNKIIHMDLKASNICYDEFTGVSFCDFGFSKKLEKDNKNKAPEDTSGLWDKDCWHLAPEVAKKIPVHPALDLYSLGKLLSVAVTYFPYWQGFKYEQDDLKPLQKFYESVIKSKYPWTDYESDGEIQPGLRLTNDLYFECNDDLENKNVNSTVLISKMANMTISTTTLEEEEEKNQSKNTSQNLVSEASEIPPPCVAPDWGLENPVVPYSQLN